MSYRVGFQSGYRKIPRSTAPGAQAGSQQSQPFETRERQRRSRLLALLLAGCITLEILLLPIGFLLHFTDVSLLAFGVVTAGNVVTIWLNRRESVDLAAASYLAGITIGSTIGLFSVPPGMLWRGNLCFLLYFLIYAFVVAASAFVSERRAPLFFAAICSTVLTVYIARHAIDFSTIPSLEGVPVGALIVISCATLAALALLCGMGAATAEYARACAEQTSQIQRLHADTEDRLGKEVEAMTASTLELTAANGALVELQAELEAQYLSLAAANKILSALATTDGMTGLANHRAFQEELVRQTARAQRTSAPLSVLLIDVDLFKQYNDSFGHPAGDEVLREVAQILKETVREGDLPARYGGEEFSVVLPDTEAMTAAQVAARIRAAVSQTMFSHRAITVSIGVAQHIHVESPGMLVKRADMALYEAKKSGRDSVMLCSLAPFPSVPAGSPGHSSDGSSNVVGRSRKPGISCVRITEETLKEGAFLKSQTEHWSLPPAETDLELLAAQTDTELFGILFPDGDLPRSADDPGSVAISLTSQPVPDKEYHLEQTEIALRNGGLEGLLQDASPQVLSSLLAMLDRRGQEPAGHSERVARYALRLANSLGEYYDEVRASRPLLPRLNIGDLIALAYGALLHDIGTMSIGEDVLQRSGKMTDEEWRQMRRHPLTGAEMLMSFPLLSRGASVARCHHERWDGEGYPQGLSGADIPLEARIFAVCDTFDILTTGRSYRARISPETALEEIRSAGGSQFDPDVVSAFLRIPAEEWSLLGCLPFGEIDPIERAA